MDIFNEMNISTKYSELNVDQFSTASLMVISHILNKGCVNTNTDSHDLPCRSYFSSNLFKHFGGEHGHITFANFKIMLKVIGLGNKSNHGNEDEEDDHGGHEDHDHRRKRREISDNSVTPPTFGIHKEVRSFIKGMREFKLLCQITAAAFQMKVLCKCFV